jgi:hypothetical protein
VVEEVEEVCVKGFPRMTKLMNDGTSRTWEKKGGERMMRDE